MREQRATIDVGLIAGGHATTTQVACDTNSEAKSAATAAPRRAGKSIRTSPGNRRICSSPHITTAFRPARPSDARAQCPCYTCAVVVVVGPRCSLIKSAPPPPPPALSRADIISRRFFPSICAHCRPPRRRHASIMHRRYLASSHASQNNGIFYTLATTSRMLWTVFYPVAQKPRTKR